MKQRQKLGLWRGGRGTRKYVFDVRSIASTVGLSVERVREHIRQRTFDPTSLSSLARFVVEQQGDAAAVAARAVLEAARGGVAAGAEVLGVSRAVLYRRAKKVTPPAP